MTDNHSNLKVIELPNGSRLVPFTYWIFKIRNSHLTFEKWHHAQYKNKGRQFPIYDCDWELPASSPALLSSSECDAMWQTVFEYFVRSRQEAGVFEEMLQIVNEEGDVYLNLNDILEFSQASKIGLKLMEGFKDSDKIENIEHATSATVRKISSDEPRQKFGRSHISIDELILLASKQDGANLNDVDSMWRAARKIAASDSKPFGIVGFCTEGIQYEGKIFESKDEYDTLSERAFKKKLRGYNARHCGSL